MKILVIEPVANQTLKEKSTGYLESNIPDDVEIEVVMIEKGPLSVETYYDEVFAAPDVLEIVQRHSSKFDGFLINCFADVGAMAAREITSKPVLGAGEASFFVAAMLGAPFSIVSIGKNARNKMTTKFGAYGLSLFKSAVGIELPVVDLEKDKDQTVEEIVRCARSEMERFGSEAIVLGCTGMSRIAQKVREKMGIPVIEPASASIRALKLLIDLDLHHPRGGRFCPPEPSKIKGYFSGKSV